MWGEFDLLERDCLLQFHIDKSAPDTFVVGKAVGFLTISFWFKKYLPVGSGMDLDCIQTLTWSL